MSRPTIKSLQAELATLKIRHLAEGESTVRKFEAETMAAQKALADEKRIRGWEKDRDAEIIATTRADLTEALRNNSALTSQLAELHALLDCLPCPPPTGPFHSVLVRLALYLSHDSAVMKAAAYHTGASE